MVHLRSSQSHKTNTVVQLRVTLSILKTADGSLLVWITGETDLSLITNSDVHLVWLLMKNILSVTGLGWCLLVVAPEVMFCLRGADSKRLLVALDEDQWAEDLDLEEEKEENSSTAQLSNQILLRDSKFTLLSKELDNVSPLNTH